MRFFEIVLSGAALIAAAWALELNDVPSAIEAGKTYTITYSPADDTPTTFILREGDPNDLNTIGTLTTTATGGSFQWTVDASLPNSDSYALEIVQDGVAPNYSGLIPLTGGSSQSSAVSSAVSATSATPSASASESATPSATASKSSETEASTLITHTATSTASVSASGSISPSASTNGTVTSATLSATRTGSQATDTSTGPPAESTGGAATLGSSPLALIFGAIAAMAYLN